LKTYRFEKYKYYASGSETQWYDRVRATATPIFNKALTINNGVKSKVRSTICILKATQFCQKLVGVPRATKDPIRIERTVAVHC
jgi:hypothetical protein